MITLRELSNVLWSITELYITARDPNSGFLHRWIYEPGITDRETIHQYHERRDGKLTLVDKRINAHGGPGRGGSEIGWGLETKLFPKAILDAPVTHMNTMGAHKGGYRVYLDIEIPELTAMTIIPKEEPDAGPDDDI